MGSLTTITISNDALHSFEKKPKEFAETLFRSINESAGKNRSLSVAVCGFINYVKVHPPRHADNETVYIHAGNTTKEINAYSEEFKSLISEKPEIGKDCIKILKRKIKEIETILK